MLTVLMRVLKRVSTYIHRYCSSCATGLLQQLNSALDTTYVFVCVLTKLVEYYITHRCTCMHSYHVLGGGGVHLTPKAIPAHREYLIHSHQLHTGNSIHFNISQELFSCRSLNFDGIRISIESRHISPVFHKYMICVHT